VLHSLGYMNTLYKTDTNYGGNGEEVITNCPLHATWHIGSQEDVAVDIYGPLTTDQPSLRFFFKFLLHFRK